MAQTLIELIAAGSDNSPALVEPDGRTVTFGALRANVEALSAQLHGYGVEPGDAVALTMPNGIAIIQTFLAVTRARAMAAPLNPAYTQDEFAFYLGDIRPRVLLVPQAGAPAARRAAELAGIPIVELAIDADGAVRAGDRRSSHAPSPPQPHDVALFLHTSGTTSRPKGVPLTHANLSASAANIARWYRLGAADVSLCVMPLFHIHGLVFSTLAHLGVGASVVIPERFSASAFWPTVAARGATIVSAVPTIYHTLLLRADDDGAPHAGEHGLRLMRSSSSALLPTAQARLEARFGVPVIQAYSMTEASHQMCANPLDGPRLPGSVGVGAFVDVGIMDDAGTLQAPGTEGEVVVRGPNVTRGYHNNPEANVAAFTNGWFRTGDRGRLDDGGYLMLVGRIKELINRGGEKISPIEIDAVLAHHPSVIEAVAFGIPDEKYGEEVAVAVVLREAVAPDALAAYVAKHLAAHKVPKRFFVTETIPKTATGKLQRRLVAAAFADKS